ncbi:hypothetical protein GCM10023224_06010 [Streptomonospora halophila]|uniref:Uncharacterized protein n=1 Tax=Streptomonospora halophila TaxID=427369 RepID=A0ABP9G8X7_9ACTN
MTGHRSLLHQTPTRDLKSIPPMRRDYAPFGFFVTVVDGLVRRGLDGFARNGRGLTGPWRGESDANGNPVSKRAICAGVIGCRYPPCADRSSGRPPTPGGHRPAARTTPASV